MIEHIDFDREVVRVRRVAKLNNDHTFSGQNTAKDGSTEVKTDHYTLVKNTTKKYAGTAEALKYRCSRTRKHLLKSRSLW